MILHHITGKHMMLEEWALTLPHQVQSLLRGGYLAVQTFFMLSGFVLARSYASTRWNRRSLMRFGIARFARIYPAYLMSLVLIAWFVVEFLFGPGRDPGQKVQVVGDYLFVLQGWTGSLSVGWNTPAWSLSCEFFFYLCFPLLFLWFRSASMPKILAALCLSFITPITLAHAGVPGIWKPVHHLSDFVAGIAAAGLYGAALRAAPWLRGRGYWLYLPALAGGAAFIIHPEVLYGTLANLNTVLRPLNVLLLAGLALGGGPTARALSTNIAEYLGKASYSMYILHIPLLWWYSRFTLQTLGSAPHLGTAMLYLAVVVGASIAAFERVEAPANRWIRDWHAARIQSAHQAPVAIAA